MHNLVFHGKLRNLHILVYFVHGLGARASGEWNEPVTAKRIKNSMERLGISRPLLRLLQDRSYAVASNVNNATHGSCCVTTKIRGGDNHKENLVPRRAHTSEAGYSTPRTPRTYTTRIPPHPRIHARRAGARVRARRSRRREPITGTATSTIRQPTEMYIETRTLAAHEVRCLPVAT